MSRGKFSLVAALSAIILSAPQALAQNPAAQPASFILRVLDRGHDWSHEDRLNLPLTIPPNTRTTVRVSLVALAEAPARRDMDLSRIADVMLFATGPLPGREFYVSRVWLEE